jgi:hypothetical protein
MMTVMNPSTLMSLVTQHQHELLQEAAARRRAGRGRRRRERH